MAITPNIEVIILFLVVSCSLGQLFIIKNEIITTKRPIIRYLGILNCYINFSQTHIHIVF